MQITNLQNLKINKIVRYYRNIIMYTHLYAGNPLELNTLTDWVISREKTKLVLPSTTMAEMPVETSVSKRESLNLNLSMVNDIVCTLAKVKENLISNKNLYRNNESIK